MQSYVSASPPIARAQAIGVFIRLVGPEKRNGAVRSLGVATDRCRPSRNRAAAGNETAPLVTEVDDDEQTRRMTRRSAPVGRLVARSVAAVVGGVGVFELFTLKPGDGPDATALLNLGQYTLWRLLIAGLTAVGIAVTPNLWALYGKLVKLHREIPGTADPQASRAQANGLIGLWVGYGLLVVAIALGQFFSTGLDPIAAWPGRSAALFVIGLLIMAPAAVGIWLATATVIRFRQVIAATAARSDGQLLWGEQQARTVQQLTQLRTLLQRLLAALSAAVSAVTLSTGALRVALLAGPHPPSYPLAAPLLLGLFFSIVVALSYLPAAVNLQDTCGQFADKVSPIPTSELSKTWSEDRQRVEKLLPTGDGTKDAVQTSIAILAPLLTSLSAVLFK
jgi:hypothetical protein